MNSNRTPGLSTKVNLMGKFGVNSDSKKGAGIYSSRNKINNSTDFTIGSPPQGSQNDLNADIDMANVDIIPIQNIN